MASSMQAIMPQVSALASCASRADTPIVFMPARLALPASRSAMMLRMSGGGVQSLRENASGTGNCSGLYMSQYLPGGLKGWCGSGNDTIRKNGASASWSCKISLRAVAEERRCVKLLGDRGPIGLRHRVIVRQAVLGPQQGFRLGIALREPAVIVAAGLVAVRSHQGDVIEAVERRLNLGVLGIPVLGRLLLVAWTAEVVAQRLGQVAGRLAIALARRRPFDDRRPGREILQMALADQRRAVAGVAQQFDKGYRIHR